MKVICTRCGGTNIACEAIVNPNTGKIIDYLDESFMHANCGDCKEEVVITDVDRVKKDIDSMFFKFVKKNGKEPDSSTTSKHQYFVRSAIPTDSKIFSVGYNMSNTGNMAFVTSKLESIKDAIENTRGSELNCLIVMFGEYLKI